MSLQSFKEDILNGIPNQLPEMPAFDPAVNHAPKRKDILSEDEKKLALTNALSYFKTDFHAALIPEFKEELEQYGRIYMYRFRPKYAMYARPVKEYPALSLQAACIMMMRQNH